MMKGDRVWFLIEEHGWGSAPSMIRNLNIRREVISSLVGEYIVVEHVEGTFKAEDAYESKKKVIQMLQQLIEEMQDKCEHESDGHHYDTRKLPMQYGPIDKTWQELLDIGCHNKCKKCGEFYR